DHHQRSGRDGGRGRRADLVGGRRARRRPRLCDESHERSARRRTVSRGPYQLADRRHERARGDHPAARDLHRLGRRACPARRAPGELRSPSRRRGRRSLGTLLMATSTAKAAPTAGDLTGRRLGRYEVLTMLASGGMATVYVARAQGVAGFERLVAIKVLHPHLAHDEDFISMFLDEARLAARIRHPNVVPTLDISDTEGDGYFLVMEYIEGDHLGALLRE